VERIELLKLHASEIVISARDGVDVISEYAEQPQTFIYADPPYFEKAGSLYMNSFSYEDHESLAQVLNGFAGSTWLLTYDNAPAVHTLYSERRRRVFELHYSANGASRASEIAVLSDAIADIEEGWTLLETA
jgi:DNA adenine methylase